jgi:hypothetical protein
MKLTEKAVKVLKTFAPINTGIFFRKGSEIAIMHPQRVIIGRAKVDDEFTQDFSIYSLPTFLGVLSLYPDAEIEFSEKFLTIVKDKSRVRMMYADPAAIVAATATTHDIPSPSAQFDLSRESMDKIKKAMAIMKFAYLQIVGEGGKVFIRGYDPRSQTSSRSRSVTPRALSMRLSRRRRGST